MFVNLRLKIQLFYVISSNLNFIALIKSLNLVIICCGTLTIEVCKEAYENLNLGLWYLYLNLNIFR